MNGLRRRVGTAIATVGLLTIGLGLAAAPSYAANDDALGGCNGVWNGNPDGSLAITSDPAAGTAVNPGDEIEVTATWDTDEFANETLDKVDACVTIDGDNVGEPVSGLEKPSDNDGIYVYTFTVPADAPFGEDVVCVRVGAHGQPAGSNPSTQKSNSACWDVEAAQTGGGGNTGGGNTGGGDTGGSNTGSGNTTGGITTQVEGATQTQTPTGGSSSEVLGIGFDAAPTGASTANTNTQATNQTTTSGSGEAASPSASVLPVTSGASPEALASTGSATQALVLLAGLALLLGGLAVSFSAPRRGLA